MNLHDYVDIQFAAQTFRLLPERVAVWKGHNMLLVADLHFGKAATFQASGMAVPSGHGETDLMKLSQLCEKFNPSSFVILGDLFHARAGVNDALVESIGKVFKSLNVSIFWIAGNHDRQLHNLAETLDVRLEKTLTLDSIELTHKPNGGETPCICGHLHPRVQLWEQKQKLELPCFVKDKTTLILPAFSSFSAGTTMKSSRDRQRFACVENKILEL
jgi:uncharacterized protein